MIEDNPPLARLHGIALLALCVAAATARTGLPEDWPQFRGPDGQGVSSETGLPTEFSEKTIAWKVPLPGPGPAGSIVVDGTVIVTAASGSLQQRLHVLGIDAATMLADAPQERIDRGDPLAAGSLGDRIHGPQWVWGSGRVDARQRRETGLRSVFVERPGVF